MSLTTLQRLWTPSYCHRPSIPWGTFHKPLPSCPFLSLVPPGSPGSSAQNGPSTVRRLPVLPELGQVRSPQSMKVLRGPFFVLLSPHHHVYLMSTHCCCLGVHILWCLRCAVWVIMLEWREKSGAYIQVLFIPPPPPLAGGGTITWPKKHRKYWAPKKIFYKAPKAPKLIYTVILWYSFVVQSPPPPPKGGNCHFMTVPLPSGGELA